MNKLMLVFLNLVLRRDSTLFGRILSLKNPLFGLGTNNIRVLRIVSVFIVIKFFHDAM